MFAGDGGAAIVAEADDGVVIGGGWGVSGRFQCEGEGPEVVGAASSGYLLTGGESCRLRLRFTNSSPPHDCRSRHRRRNPHHGTIFGATRNRAAAIDLTTGQLTSWDPQFPTSGSTVEDIGVAGNTIYIAGRFSAIAGQPCTNAAAVTLTGQLLAWAPNADGNVNDIAVAGDKVFLTGNFFNVDKQPRSGLAVVNNTDGHVLPWVSP